GRCQAAMEMGQECFMRKGMMRDEGQLCRRGRKALVHAYSSMAHTPLRTHTTQEKKPPQTQRFHEKKRKKKTKLHATLSHQNSHLSLPNRRERHFTGRGHRLTMPRCCRCCG